MQRDREKQFTYGYLPGTNLLQTLVKPNNMTLTQSYEEKRDLLISQLYKRSNASVASRTYTYDTLGRPMTRSTSEDGSTVNDSFGYNSRSELNIATVNNEAYAYDYDNIGNRETAQEAAEAATAYESNSLNQYPAIGDFEPSYDDAGNQTREKKAKAMKDYWDKLYDQIERNTPPTWKMPGLHCTSTTCKSLDGKGVRGYMDPLYFFKHILVDLRHECGSQQGEKVYITKVRSYFY